MKRLMVLDMERMDNRRIAKRVYDAYCARGRPVNRMRKGLTELPNNFFLRSFGCRMRKENIA